ncbi:hypothetical protein [Nonomuraea glycinis]
MNAIALIVLGWEFTPPDAQELPAPDPDQKAADPAESTSGTRA